MTALNLNDTFTSSTDPSGETKANAIRKAMNATALLLGLMISSTAFAGGFEMRLPFAPEKSTATQPEEEESTGEISLVGAKSIRFLSGDAQAPFNRVSLSLDDMGIQSGDVLLVSASLTTPRQTGPFQFLGDVQPASPIVHSVYWKDRHYSAVHHVLNGTEREVSVGYPNENSLVGHRTLAIMVYRGASVADVATVFGGGSSATGSYKTPAISPLNNGDALAILNNHHYSASSGGGRGNLEAGEVTSKGGQLLTTNGHHASHSGIGIRVNAYHFPQGGPINMAEPIRVSYGSGSYIMSTFRLSPK